MKIIKQRCGSILCGRCSPLRRAVQGLILVQKIHAHKKKGGGRNGVLYITIDRLGAKHAFVVVCCVSTCSPE